MKRAPRPARGARDAVTPPPLPKGQRKPKTKRPNPTNTALKSLPINKEKRKGGARKVGLNKAEGLRIDRFLPIGDFNTIGSLNPFAYKGRAYRSAYPLAKE